MKKSNSAAEILDTQSAGSNNKTKEKKASRSETHLEIRQDSVGEISWTDKIGSRWSSFDARSVSQYNIDLRVRKKIRCTNLAGADTLHIKVSF